MAKIKASYGDFASATAGPGDTIVNDGNVTLNMRKEICFAITNRCRVHGVFFFNIEDDEKEVKLTDYAGGNYADAITAPIIYSTIVPRDASFSKTLSLGIEPVEWTSTFSVDLYDTPSGIYDTFPKPGFLFEDGVSVWCNTAGTGPKLHWIIFYSE